MNKNSLRQRLGILRSQIMYYGKPFNRRKLTQFYSQFVKKGDLCFDIGSHLGNRVDAWVRLGANVVALEPQPACMNYLQRRFGHNPDVTLLQKAVSNEPGTLELHVSQLTPTISTLADESWRETMRDKTSFHVQWDHAIPVEVVTLDQLIERHGIPAFCKIDVEDFEVNVLKGLSQPIPALSIEYFTPTMDRAIMCIDIISSLGPYTFNWSFGESQVMESSTWLSADQIKSILQNYTPEDRSGDVYARLSPN